MDNLYRRTAKISDFQPNSGSTVVDIVLDNKINFLIYLTQNIEDIGIYQDTKSDGRADIEDVINNRG
jgi:hypothetical protein